MTATRRSSAALLSVLLLVGSVAVASMVTAAPVAAGINSIGPVDPTIPDNDPGSLRDVLFNQVTDGDTVILEAGAIYALDICAFGTLNILADVTIDGNGATIAGNGCDGVLFTDNSLVLDSVTVRGGRGGDAAGLNATDETESVAIYNSTFTDNISTDDASAIDARGGLTIVGSTIWGNTADNEAAVRVIGESAELLVVNSTISGNTGGVGTFATGGISARTGTTVTVVYSTIAGNVIVEDPVDDGVDTMGDGADDDGLVPQGIPTEAANVSIIDARFSVFGTVIALPSGAPNCRIEVGIGTQTAGYNFSDDDSCDLDAATDAQDAGDPGLGALAPNGGPTLTRLPGAGSPLLNRIPVAACAGGNELAGPLAPITSDQRGVARPQENGCETGSVEVEAPSPVVVTPTFTG